MIRASLAIAFVVAVAWPASPTRAACPVDEGFDAYAAGSDLHGQGGWKGIDNDPFFTAFVSTPPEPANSPPGSVDIELSANLVRETGCVGEPLVVLSVQQYIASPYTGGVPSEPDPGTFFNVYNTYSDGGTQRLSTSIRFDPSGVAKVWNGNASVPLDVPYVTDRWVKIQQVVDLDNDWTRVYYDDELVTEYSWTGGVLGSGGGALDIAAVDLYANGSTSVYYDDLVIEPISPFEDDFEGYANGSDIHGQGGWKGFDNVPTAGAPLTADQANSGSQSLEVAGAANPLHETDTSFDGVWSFATWQYIPSDFLSGGGIEPDAGSLFRLHSTYSDGGTQERAVEIRVDSSASKLEVFSGSGLVTVDVPYDTDRWVKIQALVDLDDDWTQIYYDDELVTEYSWTGGILGGSGGALDIAAVDLYGNGASEIYYDDVKLQRGCGVGLDSDVDGDGRSVGQELRQGTDSCRADSVPALPPIAAFGLVVSLLVVGARVCLRR